MRPPLSGTVGNVNFGAAGHRIQAAQIFVMQLGKNMERKNLTAMRVTGNFQVKIAPGKIRRRMRHQQAVSSLSGFGKSAVQVGRFAIGRSGKSIGNAGEIKVFADGRAVVFQNIKPRLANSRTVSS